ncbi:MAG: hypothetical protein IJQ22_05605 [Bacteroidales bacterium]|nr:hypothetical protein [Bacteroidales bacterium]
MMRSIYCSVLAILLCANVSAAPKINDFPANDSRITYVARTFTEVNDVSFDWTGSYIRIAFEGDYLSVNLSDSGRDWFNVWLDGPFSKDADRIITAKGDTTLVLCDADILKARYGKKAPRQHTIILQKRTEASQGSVTIHGFKAEKLLQAAPVKNRVIEFIGDSFTCGYGAENSKPSDPFRPEDENQNHTHAAILGRYFDADILVAAHSGQGVNRNYNDGGRGYTMVDRYLRIFDSSDQKDADSPKWQPSAFQVKPALTVIYLGENDFSRQRQPSKRAFTEDYIKLLKEIKAFYGEDHPILCAAPRIEVFEYVQTAVEQAGMKNVACTGIFRKAFLVTETGSAGHPAYPAQLKIAHNFIPYVSSLTGWPMEEKAIR